MSKILFVWEMGENLGHLARDLTVARRLVASGHKVGFAIKDMRVARTILNEEHFSFIQAPRLSGHVPISRPACYSEILMAHGYHSELALSGLITAWRQLLREQKPDVIVANHAPTAVLASKCENIPVVATCIGFEFPLSSNVPTAFRPGIAAAERLLASDKLALKNINTVLAASGRAQVSAISEIFSNADIVMTTYPDLDHYGPRSLHYVGPLGYLNAPKKHWPGSSSKKIFCYLRPDAPSLNLILESLAKTDFDVLCVAPGINRQTPGSNVILETNLVDATAAIQDAAAVISHGTGTVHDALAQGKPLLLVPNNMEQFMIAARVVALGAGIILPNGASVDAVTATINYLLTDSSFTEAAERFSAVASAYRADDAVSDIVRRIERLHR